MLDHRVKSVRTPHTNILNDVYMIEDQIMGEKTAINYLRKQGFHIYEAKKYLELLPSAFRLKIKGLIK